MTGSVEALRELVGASLADSGLDGVELWDVEVAGDTVRVLVDREGGIDLDALSQIDGRLISPLLDAHPELTPSGAFTLEVSSPGLERPLRRPEHYARYVGREVAVKTRVPVSGSRRWQGILAGVADGGMVLRADGGAELAIAFDDIDRARPVVKWGPAPKPGKQKQAAKRPAADGLPGAAQPVAFTEGRAE